MRCDRLPLGLGLGHMQRLTKIVCTIGPSCSSKDGLRSLVHAGMNVARINLSHATWEDHAKVIKVIKEVNAENAKKGIPPVAILMDTKGAEVRTGVVEKPIVVKEGETVIFSFKPIKNADKQVVLVNHKLFATDAKDADCIVIDNGKMMFDYVKTRADGGVEAKANESGIIGSRRHVNLPGANLHMPSLTEKDWEDIQHSIDIEADYIALSFIREASEVAEVRRYVDKHKSNMQLIAKMETRQCIENMEEIIKVSDGIMVARGDLGSEMAFERIPVIQDTLVALTHRAGKPVIVATHMLESMIENPTPTRAEVTDIAHAATTGTDSTMLSGETASGQFPIASLDAMSRVLAETERHIHQTHPHILPEYGDTRDAQAEAAVLLASSSNVRALLAMTKTGKTAIDLSHFRPSIPVIAATPEQYVERRLQLYFGVRPINVPFSSDPEKTVMTAVKQAVASKLLKKGDKYVLVSDAKAHGKNISTIQVRMVE